MFAAGKINPRIKLRTVVGCHRPSDALCVAGGRAPRAVLVRDAISFLGLRTGFGGQCRAMRKGGFLTALLAFLTVQGLAQNAYFSRPILIVVPFASGGGNDLSADKLQKRGQPLVLENKLVAGANCTRSWRAVDARMVV